MATLRKSTLQSKKSGSRPSRMGVVTTDPKILMLAGEHSGDLLGGELIRELKKTFLTWKPSG